MIHTQPLERHLTSFCIILPYFTFYPDHCYQSSVITGLPGRSRKTLRLLLAEFGGPSQFHHPPVWRPLVHRRCRFNVKVGKSRTGARLHLGLLGVGNYANGWLHLKSFNSLLCMGCLLFNSFGKRMSSHDAATFHSIN